MAEYKIEESKRKAITAAFWTVLDNAVPLGRSLDRYDKRTREFLEKETARLAYEPLMRFGGEREKYFVDRFFEVAREEGFEDRALAIDLANKFLATAGRGYVMTKLACVKGAGNGLMRKWDKTAETLRYERRHLKAWFYEQCLLGEPVVITDFELEPKYTLIRIIQGVHEHIRMVRIRNDRGELTPLVPMTADDFSDPRHFRKFLLSKGNFTFGLSRGAGVTELNIIQHDMAFGLCGRTVREQCEYGWHELDSEEKTGQERRVIRNDDVLQGLWFFRDCVATPTGGWLFPDSNGIVTWNGDRFRLSEASYDDQPFSLSVPPTMNLDRSYQDVEFEVNGDEETFTGKGKTDRDIVCALFRELYNRLLDTLGSESAGYVLGSLLSFASAPEIYAKSGEFPGLWAHGQAGSGKTYLIRWLMEIWGYKELKPLILKGRDSTAVGLGISLSQVSNLPLWGDEFRVTEVEADKVAVIHNAYNRGKGVKWSQKGMERRAPRTAFVVSGESTTTDPATRGRYAHILIAANLRRANHVAWFQNTAKYFSLIGRYLLENRREFSAGHRRNLARWMDDKTFVLSEERQRFVYGVGYSAFLTAVTMLESHVADELHAVRTATIKAAAEGVADVVSDIGVNQFWQDLITLHRRNELRGNWIRFNKTTVAHPPGSPNQGSWLSIAMLIQPEPVLAAINEMRARGRGERTLARKDLVAQMGAEHYWEKDKKLKRVRFGAGSAKSYCWCVYLDRHDLGYQQVSDEEWSEYQALTGTQRTAAGDPRRGDLFEIFDAHETEEDESKQKREPS